MKSVFKKILLIASIIISCKIVIFLLMSLFYAFFFFFPNKATPDIMAAVLAEQPKDLCELNTALRKEVCPFYNDMYLFEDSEKERAIMSRWTEINRGDIHWEKVVWYGQLESRNKIKYIVKKEAESPKRQFLGSGNTLVCYYFLLDEKLGILGYEKHEFSFE